MTYPLSHVHHGIKDNHNRGRVAEFLSDEVTQGSHLSVVSAYFTIYAYEALRKELDSVESLQFLFGEPRFIQALDPEKTDKKAFKIEDEGLELSNRLQQKEVARRCADWIQNKVEIRSVKHPGFLHGNPVRIIQLINFWPTPDLNEYINLKNRVEARMALVDISATSDDNILTNAELEELIQQDLKYRDKQLMRLKDEVLDLEDFNESVALNEFSLDDFRMDLSNYVEANRTKLQDAPFGLYGVVPSSAASTEHAGVKPGVIYCLRQQRPEAAPGAESPSQAVNPLSPYFLVYIQADGTVRYNFTAPKQVLEIFRALCQGKTEPYADLCKLFDDQTCHGQDMSAYSKLLDKTVAAIVAQFSRKNAANLFTGRGGKLIDSTKAVKSNTDFDLITWLVIK
ncbi:MAG: hypothetical protein RLZZ401_395 [Pseudomonadota bacterium]|jgi:hypothetical protein